MIRLVQLQRDHERAVGLVDDGRLRLLREFPSVYALAQQALRDGQPLARVAADAAGDRWLDYDEVYRGDSEFHLLPAWDHPEAPARCMVSGTGLTHQASAKNRQAMHEQNHAQLTDSMKMYRLGLEGGRPPRGGIGVAPEWFFKGNGTILRAHGDALTVPAFAGGGGEEPEIAGCYLIDDLGRPRRVGLAAANEFSDHVTERMNYLYLAPSKLRTCALGPELCVDADFSDVRGQVRIERAGRTLWATDIATGEAKMSHSLANLEHHHFKFPQHRMRGDAHVHFLGADAFSSGAGVELQDGDLMVVQWLGFGRPLANPLQVELRPQTLIEVLPL
jgi:hypothetical protein